ncbi:MAG: 2-dehydropantoate 2-reductase [Anaerolineaceae bacterium]|nr:2-dehydropantoate 2-reductase [Anaerolineaceae bacterium]
MKNTHSSPLHVLCFGVGAIGTYIGGSLALAGHWVVFVERPEIADEVRQRGLRLRIRGEELVIEQPEVLNSIGEALERSPFDVAILAIKSFDTPQFIESLKPYRDSIPPVLCLQNGVENESLIAELLGKERVIAGTVTSAIGRREAGDIALERLRGMGVAAGHPLAPSLVMAMDRAGLNCRLFRHVDGMKWSKMLTNLLANASSAILDMTPAEIYAHPGLFRLEVAQLREALAVMHALRIPLVDLPRTQVRLLGWIVERLPVGFSRPLLARTIGKGRGAKMPSFHIDLYSGRGKSEVDYLNGAVVRGGNRAGIPTPVNRVLTQTLLDLTEGNIQREEYARQPEKLLAAIKMNA